MFRLSTVNLSEDYAHAGAEHGTVERGELTREQLIALLENFRGLATAQNEDADPHLLLTSTVGRFLVRAGRGKLFLYNARVTVEPYAELSPEEIVTQLERDNITLAPFPHLAADSSVPPTPPRRSSHRGIALAILVAGLAVNGYTLYSIFYTDTVNDAPVVALLTEPAELAAVAREVVGTYATGNRTGDRVIVVEPDGRVRFSEIGSKNSILNNTTTYRLGRQLRKLCLTTADSGIIDLIDSSTLVYYRDTYHRVP